MAKGSVCRGRGGVGGFERGFSLAEIATVLILIGLVTGLLVLGEGIVAQARVKFVINQFEGLKIAVLHYYDRYAALPGDDPRAESRWAGRSRNGTGDGRIGGLYQAPPPPGDPMTSLTIDAASVPVPGDGESLNFWWHLRLADLIVAPPMPITPVAQPLNPFAGVIGVEWAPLGFPRLAVCAANLPGYVAAGVENQLDDGNPRQGLIRAAKQSADNQPIAAANATITAFESGDDKAYILCRRLD